jgi:branched-chain amino acid transport system substrate-binding protein
VKGGSNDSATVQKNFPAVSGATGGEKCTTYADCVALLGEGKDIQYTGPSGIGPINAQNDPSSGFIGIYNFDETNKPIFTSVVEAAVQ